MYAVPTGSYCEYSQRPCPKGRYGNSVAKETLQSSLGLEKVSQAEVELFIRKGAQDKAMQAMKAAASTNVTVAQKKQP